MTDLTLRNVKGSPLTNQEVDDNFSGLNTDKYQAGDSPTFADVTADSVQLTGGTGSQGLVTWNSDEETLDIIQNGATLQVGQEVQIHCRNNTGSTIGDGVAVYATGTIGNSGRITVAPMIANGTTPAKFFLGITTEEILNGEDGKVTTFGKVRGLNTTAYSDGDVLYVSPTTAGALTATMPAAPNLSLPVAFVIHAHSSGTIFCRATARDENESLKAANNLSDLANAATARTNLGLGTMATEASADYLPLTGGTLSGALDVTGTVTADGLTVDGNVGLVGAGETRLFNANLPADSLKIGGASQIKFETYDGVSWRDRASISNNGNVSLFEDTGTTAKFFWDASAESLGIGTSSPAYPLQVRTTGTGTAFASNIVSRLESNGSGYNSTLQFSNNVDASATIGLVGSSLGFGVGTTQMLTLDSSGNVGIGTSSPSANLHIYKNTTANEVLRIEQGTTAYGAQALFKNPHNSSFYFGLAGDSTGDTIHYNGANSNSLFYTNATERMRIDSAGRVGIGTTAPATGLDVNGQGSFKKNYSYSSTNYHIKLNSDYAGGGSSYIANITSSNRMDISAGGYYYGGGLYQLTDGATGMGTINIGEDGTFTYQSISGATANSTVNPAERWRIDSSGNLLVGKTTSSIATAGTAIRGDNPGLINSVRNGVILELNRLSTDGNIVDFFKDGTTVGSVGTVGGVLTIGNGDTGLLFSGSGDYITPRNPTTQAGRDASIDLGTGSDRFKDLYLSGGVYLGGTGSANYLDDYEEGTFGGTANGWTVSGQYTKIGQIVHVRGYVTLVSATLNKWTDMPFAASISQTSINGTNAGHITINNVSTYAAGSFAHVYNNTNDLYIYNSTGATYNNPANGSFAFNFTYTTT